MMGEDGQKYLTNSQRPEDVSNKDSSQIKGQTENNNEDIGKETEGTLEYCKDHGRGLLEKKGDFDKDTRNSSGFGSKTGMTSNKVFLGKESHSTELGGVKGLIRRFSGGETAPLSPAGSPSGTSTSSKIYTDTGISDSELMEAKRTLDRNRPTEEDSASKHNMLPSIILIPPENNALATQNRGKEVFCRYPNGLINDNTKTTVRQNGRGLPSRRVDLFGKGLEANFDSDKQSESPPSEEDPSPTKVGQNPKYQLYLDSEMLGNGSRDPDGMARENGPLHSGWERSSSRFAPNYRGSLESLASRDWDTMSDRMGGFESPPRAFNSPYAAPSIDFSQIYRMPECKDTTSPASSELNLYSFNSRCASPVPSPSPSSSIFSPRGRFLAYDTLARRREVASNPSSLRQGVPNKRDYIEEITRQLEECQKRNQFLEAESIQMDKERNQIRFEMRALLVNKEDLLRTNTQLQVDMRRMSERMSELERENTVMNERFRKQESALQEAREVMVEANTQEYAFNFLQQSLKNKIKDAEEALEKQMEHSKGLMEKLWNAERELEELTADKQSREKKTQELSSTVLRLEMELGEALQMENQAKSELNIHQKLQDDAQQQLEDLEEKLLDKTLELQKAQQTISKLQGEISVKLNETERDLEEEIQLREKVQLQCKQAERMVEDLQMELQTISQTKEDHVKQLKQSQEKVIDLESELDEMLDNERMWSSKHKRAVEQTEQLQLKLLQEKDLNEEMNCEKAILQRQIKDLQMEVDQLQTTRVQEDVITKAESKVKELESFLRTEERNKVMLTNTIGKLERKISELSNQMVEDQKMATEQKDLMTQKIRTLKRQLNEAEEVGSVRETQLRHIQRELAEERETVSRLQRQLLDQQLQRKRQESSVMRQTLESFRLDLSVDDEDEEDGVKTSNADKS